MPDVEFRKGLIALDTVAGDHVGFTRAVPLSTRRKLRGTSWWEAPASDAPAVVAWADTKHLTVAQDVRSYASHLWQVESRNMARATATAAPGPLPAVRGLSTSLLATQQVIVAASLDAWFEPPGDGNAERHRAIILADDQGLGKTLTALAVLRTQGGEAHRAVIVCPSSLTENWHGEAREHFEPGTFSTWTATSRTPHPIPDDVDTVVIGWDILLDWKDSLIAWGPDAVIADEGHYAKSGKQTKRKETTAKLDEHGNTVYRGGKAVMEPVMIEAKGPGGKPIIGADGHPKMEQKVTVLSGSGRAQAILDIGKAVAKTHGLIMPMTGTPIVNRPLELLALIQFSGIEKLFLSSLGFKDRYCGPTWKKIGDGRSTKDYSGASNLLELNTRLLTSGVYYRRTKQVLVDQGLLKKKYVDKVYAYDYGAKPQPWMIRLNDDERAEYMSAYDETKGFFVARAREIAAEKRMGMDTQVVQRKVAAEGAKHLKLITELRQTVARLKVPYVSAQVQLLIDRGEKVVIAAHHKEAVTAYAETFGGLRIQGGMGAKAIEEAKALFNGTPVSEYPVMVLSVEAGKTGHTLCKQTLEGAGPACAFMIFAEQVWTPGDEAQTQDRIWRIGQDREVRISNALAVDTIDESMYWQRQRKRYVFNAVIDSIDQQTLEASASDEKQGAGRLAQELVYGRAA